MANYNTIQILTGIKNWVLGKLTSTYKAAGSCASVAALGTLDAAHEGYVYDMTAEFTTTSDFKDYASQGAKTFPAGTQVAIVNTGTAQSPVYKYDTMSSFVDLSDYATKEEIADTPDFVEEELTPDMQNEIDRALEALYQALTDAQEVTATATSAAALAQQKASVAQNAATAANDAADNALQKATYANTKAGYAQEQGDYAQVQGNYAKAQGDYAKSEIDGAKGSYQTLDARMTAIETDIANDVEFVEDNTDTFPFN